MKEWLVVGGGGAVARRVVFRRPGVIELDEITSMYSYFGCGEIAAHSAAKAESSS
jgi:hypothetical protein